MANSLQDQLLKAGLVDKKKLKQVTQAKKKQGKQQRKSKEVAVDESKLQAQLSLAEKAERGRELNRQRVEQAEQKAITAQIKQLIEMNRLKKGEGDVAYNFVDGKKIKKLFVTAKQQDQLVRGLLAIVKLDDQYEIVPSPVAEKIRLRNDSCVILCNEVQQNDEDDDYYADYKIPDDLMW